MRIEIERAALTLVFADAAIHVLSKEKSQTFGDVLSHFHANELLLNVAVPIDRAAELTSIFSEILSIDATFFSSSF